MDRCGPAPDSGFGHIVEYPEARLSWLTEEHGILELDGATPKVGEQLHIIPNHICPVVNLHEQLWWCDGGDAPEAIPVEARGKLS